MRIPGVEATLDRMEDLFGVPSLAMQLEWHRRNPTPPEPTVLDGHGNGPQNALAHDSTVAESQLGRMNALGMVGTGAMDYYKRAMLQQCDSSAALFEEIRRQNAVLSMWTDDDGQVLTGMPGSRLSPFPDKLPR